MPVRVKQRTLALEDRSEQEKQWDGLKRSLAALLIASGRALSLRVKDAATGKLFAILETKSSSSRLLEQESDGQSQSGRMRLALSVIGQAGLVTLNNKSWIPASASSRIVVIKGAISLEPVPTKTIQFLSIGIHPLAQSAHNELYDYINKLFSHSHFGVIDDEEPAREEQRRRQKDSRFKEDSFANKQKLLKKGVDRWPMFVLNICLKNSKIRASKDEFFQRETGLKSVVEVLDALITGWLESHRFRSSSDARKRRRVGPSDTEQEDIESAEATTDSSNLPRSSQICLRPIRPSTAPSSWGTSTEQAKKLKPRSAMSGYTGIANFNKMSRIKSSNTAMPLATATDKPPHNCFHISTSIPDSTPHFLNSEILLPGKLTSIRHTSSEHRTLASNEHLPVMNRVGETVPNRYEDEVQDWTDPITKKQHKVNSRTGAAIVPDQSRAEYIAEGGTRTLLDHSIRLSSNKPVRSNSVKSETHGFLDTLLETWKNPIFSSTDKTIPQISLDGLGDSNSVSFPAGKHIDLNFDQISKINASKLTKSALKKAKVIAQVDRKFILVTMEVEEKRKGKKTLLVAVDQHAADERCRVEELLEELCTPNSDAGVQSPLDSGHGPCIETANLPTPMIFRISEREGEAFTLHTAHFAKWGILFDMTTPRDAQGKRDLVVQAVPPLISQRLAQEPKKLISLLRTELYHIMENPSHTTYKTHSPSPSACPSPLVPSALTPVPTQTNSTWLNRIHKIPRGIIDLISSRACRSAIMFNDELSRHECKDLVERLGTCVFPFICAHGRPSMVPLVHLGGEDIEEGFEGIFDGFGTGDRSGNVEDGFGEAFRRWREHHEGALEMENVEI
jgi:DNA mismatch repair protein MLH3